MTADLDVPVDRDAERAVLGAALISQASLDDAANIVTPADFYDPRHEAIFAAALALSRTGVQPDPVTVADHLGSDLARMGGPAYLHELVASVPTHANATHYAGIVSEMATRRRLVAAGRRVVEMSLARDTAPTDLVDLARAAVDACAPDDQDDAPHAVAVWQAIDALDEGPGIPTAWPSITDTIAGWKKGCLYLVGARPAVGKSVVAINAVLDVARRGATGMLFSLEMSKVELYHRMLSNVGSVRGEVLQHRALDAESAQALSKAAEHIAALPLVVDDRAGMTVAQIRARVRREQRRGKVGLVAVDYLGLIRPPAETLRMGRREQVDAISRDLKLMAKELDVPVLALAQLNRGSEARLDKRPTLSDLRESGALEQDSDVVFLLHRDTTDPVNGANLHVLVAKNRHGPARALSLIFRGHYSRIDDHP